jgi:tRNA threonylcarbamoyladenosine biosynthesis protein TsaB
MDAERRRETATEIDSAGVRRLVLAWDTATTIATAALVDVGPDHATKILAQRVGDGSESHSAFLPPAIEDIFKSAEIFPKEVDLLAVGRGPGSFTGLRAGLALAAGLGLAAGLPVIGASTLRILAAGGSAGLIAPVVDARRGELFTALFRSRGEGADPEPLSEPLVVKPAMLFDVLDGYRPSGETARILGPAVDLTPEPPAGWETTPAAPPRAEILAALGSRLLSAGGFDENPPTPIYGRSPEIFKTWTPPKRSPSL